MDENTKKTEELIVEQNFELEIDYLDQEKQEEKLWQARTGLNLDTLCGAIETVVFMNEKPISIVKIKELIDPDMPLKVLHDSLARLQKEYEEGHHGIRLVEVAEGYQFRTKATYSKYVQDLFKVNSLVLGPTALEVLAIIAYKQPVAKTEVDKIRGVDSSHIVRALMDKRLVKMVGRAEDAGRPTLYGTTLEFLEVFNLPNIESLPPQHELESMAANPVVSMSDIKNLVNSSDKQQFKFDEWEELDKLTESIKAIHSETPFTKSLEEEDKKRTNTEGQVIKSAFDLLEEYIVRKKVTDQNQLAGASQLFAVSDELRVIGDLSQGPFNVPIQGEDEFEMIDLNTGLPLSSQSHEDNESDEENEVDLSEMDNLNDFFNETNLDSQKEALGRALDEMLEKGLDSTFDNWEKIDQEDELSLETMLSDKEDKLSAPLEEMIHKGEELGIDISFLRDQGEEVNDDSPDEE